MRDNLREKGIVLLMVNALCLVVFIGIMGLLFVLRANIRNLESFKERVKAYYLCETAASVAVLDQAKGLIGKNPPQWTERTFHYNVDGKNYSLAYKASKVSGVWRFENSTSPSDFNRIYKLSVGGRRSFPIFIRGLGAGM